MTLEATIILIYMVILFNKQGDTPLHQKNDRLTYFSEQFKSHNSIQIVMFFHILFEFLLHCPNWSVSHND